jgi:hypothetical protein
MATTTIRVDTATHAELLTLSQLSGKSLIETVKAATKALRRQQFAQSVSEELQTLRENPDRWDAYIADSGAAVSDGIA